MRTPPRTPPAISVLLPMHRPAPTLDHAIAGVLDQRPGPAEILLLVNGPSHAARDAAEEWTTRDPRFRVIELPEPSLAAALNRGLHAARGEFLARMDDDDETLPGRFATQLARLEADPTLAAVGGAFEVVSPEGALEHVIRPPTEPPALRRELLLGNTLAHGSMMLRRSAILKVGGYDESFDRAQDYELWLRLARTHRVGAVAETVYRYHRPAGAAGLASTSPRQGELAERARRRDLDLLPTGERIPPSDAASIEAIIDRQGPTRALIERLAELRSSAARSAGNLTDQQRWARIERAFDRARRGGAMGVWLWGAGEHTRRLLARCRALPLPVLGLIDDACAGRTRFGFRVRRPEDLPFGAHAIVSSDAHEERILDRATALPPGRAVVHAIYRDEPGAPGDQESSAGEGLSERRVS